MSTLAWKCPDVVCSSFQLVFLRLPSLDTKLYQLNPTWLPLAMSSPNKAKQHSFQNLHLLEINFQSILSKRKEFWSLVEAVKPDVIYGCENWLKPSISQGEVFPRGYDLYRCDRKDGYGGVLLGIHSSLNNHQMVIKTEADFIAAKIINGNQSIIVASL